MKGAVKVVKRFLPWLLCVVLFCDTREKGPTVSQAASSLGKRDSVWIT